MLDTDACIRFMNRTHPKLTERVVAQRADAFCISIITAAELQFGVERSANRAKSRERLREFRATIPTVGFDEPAAQSYAAARAELARKGSPIGPLEPLIAGHALCLGLTLITDNVREFGRIKGLLVEDWS
jgi:tRNA(fMet)-specific endonuclease VapC